jgi:hypothetical protein
MLAARSPRPDPPPSEDATMSTTTKAAVAVVALIVLGVAFWLVRPLFVTTEVDEAFPLSAGASVPDDMTQEEVEAEMAAAAGQDVEEVEPMPEGEPTALLTGSFAGVDSAHQGSGSATLYELADGSRVLRFEDFEVTNGPDLRVYLAPVDDAGEPDVGAGTELGRLKGNVGNQNYDVPADLDTTGPLAVVIYCQPFSVTFATAPLG